MASPEDDVYPSASPTGDAIPYDIGKPEGLFIVDFTTTVSAAKALPATYDIVIMIATKDCVVRFGAAANLTRDTDQPDAQYMPANTPVSVKLPASSLTVIGVAESGILYVQKYRRWLALSTETLQSRI